mgnify:CR=1 FL=1|tara:strand:- start:761 stop:982 length:222 start_codon:yes stop_codon:yes gene_type:complete
MDIRKISIGADYKLSAMHYIVSQEILGGSHTIQLIKEVDEAYQIWIVNKSNEVYLWKEFRKTLPISLEFNINF